MGEDDTDVNDINEELRDISGVDIIVGEDGGDIVGQNAQNIL